MTNTSNLNPEVGGRSRQARELCGNLEPLPSTVIVLTKQSWINLISAALWLRQGSVQADHFLTSFTWMRMDGACGSSCSFSHLCPPVKGGGSVSCGGRRYLTYCLDCSSCCCLGRCYHTAVMHLIDAVIIINKMVTGIIKCTAS